MFGIGGSELIFILLIAVMLFGADKIPEIARTLGKGMAQLKNATEDIKTEITKSAEENGLDLKSLTGGITEEIDSVKQGLNKMVSDVTPENPMNIRSLADDITADMNKAIKNIDDIKEGPIKRQM